MNAAQRCSALKLAGILTRTAGGVPVRTSWSARTSIASWYRRWNDIAGITGGAIGRQEGSRVVARSAVLQRPGAAEATSPAKAPGWDADVSSLLWLLLVAACVLVVYAAFVTALIVAGRWQGARDVARFIRDCIVLVRRLLGDPRVPRRHKLLLGVLVGYLVLPFDLVPDFIPVAGHLDDALVVVLALRAVLRGSGSDLLREHWRGPESSLAIVLRFAGAPAGGRATNDAGTES